MSSVITSASGGQFEMVFRKTQRPSHGRRDDDATSDYLSISVSTYLTNPSFWILSAIWPTFSRPGTSRNAT